MNFDWATLALQLVNIGILLAILKHFLFRPVAAIIARRQAETDAALRAAETARTEAEAATRKAEAEEQATATARARVLAEAQTEAEAARQALIEAARTEAAKIVAAGEAARQADDARASAQALERARDLAGTIAARALAAQPHDLAGYVERLAKALDALPAAERAALLAGDTLRLTTPVLPPEAERDSLIAPLARFGIAPLWAEDATLIAGLDLTSSSGAVRNSLAHDLDLIARALGHERN
ncbi:F0F1 ATP synthase subunit B family protein [Paenirhodobacter enshiensis]|uniref:F0F1 ATP synthase subunit B family protein n=1 Tax=Paenirhodobacter enshiensis TaxID=1105367 RepID=UPI0035AEC039